mgnify:CR=1 FL=1|jgi:hypothetical protein
MQITLKIQHFQLKVVLNLKEVAIALDGHMCTIFILNA